MTAPRWNESREPLHALLVSEISTMLSAPTRAEEAPIVTKANWLTHPACQDRAGWELGWLLGVRVWTAVDFALREAGSIDEALALLGISRLDLPELLNVSHFAGHRCHMPHSLAEFTA